MVKSKSSSRSSSKARTSSSKNNNLKLKWWYVLPVIAIVAVAGYAIVSFGMAGALPGIKIVNSGLDCSQGTIVTRSNAKECVVPVAKMATAVWPSSQYIPQGYRSFCATVYFGANSSVAIRSYVTTPTGNPGSDLTTVYKKTPGYYAVCSGPWQATPPPPPPPPPPVTAYVTKGDLAVCGSVFGDGRTINSTTNWKGWGVDGTSTATVQAAPTFEVWEGTTLIQTFTANVFDQNYNIFFSGLGYPIGTGTNYSVDMPIASELRSGTPRTVTVKIGGTVVRTVTFTCASSTTVSQASSTAITNDP